MTQDDVSAAEIIWPANDARSKVREVSSIDGMLARADEAVGTLSADFWDRARADIRHLGLLCRGARADPARRVEHLRAAAALVHEIRGQGGTFDFPLITEVATSLFRFLDDGAECMDERGVVVVELHVEAMRLIIDQRLHGRGDAQARAMVDGLAAAAARFAYGESAV